MSKRSIWVSLAASNHSDYEREERDFYATEPYALEVLINEGKVKFSKNVLEPSAGNGHLSKVLKEHGYNVTSKDIIQREYPLDGIWDFLTTEEKWHGDIVMNPPYKNALEHVKKALDMIEDGNRVFALLKIQFLEGKARKEFFKVQALKTLYVSSSRLNCANNGKFDEYKSSAVAYCWYEFEKGHRGDPVIKWIN